MQDFETGTVRANQLTFAYLTQGDGPLALCIHGFPDSPYSYRYLLPALADAGYRAVAPFNRGFAPTELPDDRHHIHSSTMVVDQMALHEALGGDSDAVLIAHDWGAVEQFTHILSKEFGPRGITVNAVSPGATETETYRTGKSEQFLANLKAMSAFGRLGQPDEIAAVVAFLASDAAGWVTAQTIRVNGGTI